LTYLIVRYGLMELTNFSLSNIGYLYEDMASSILATPKAYIIVVSTAFLASRMNLYYGWDFNGILIPSLLALQWYQPIKILATLVESCIILWLAILLLKTPILSKMTIEGARKLLLFFNISFAYKIILGYAILLAFPAEKVTDYFGFGYLLSTLVAVKIHDKAIFARLTRATLQTSLTAVATASLIGFSLTLLPFTKLLTATESSATATDFVKASPEVKQDLTALLQHEQVDLYQNKLSNTFVAPLSTEIEAFASALKYLQAYLKQPHSFKLQEAAGYLKQANYSLELLNNGRYVVLRENAPIRGWGLYVIDTQATSDLALEIPAPLDENGTFDAGVILFNGFAARSLAISGSRRKHYSDVSADVLKSQQSFFQVFHRTINRDNSLQLRKYNAEMARQVAGVRRSDTKEPTTLSSGLWVKGRLPDSLDLAKLKQLINHYEINWTQPPFVNQQREASHYGFAELILTQDDLRKVLLRPLLLSQKTPVQTVEQTLRIEGYLQNWILSRKQFIAAKGSQLYRPPKQEELLYFDEQVLVPLLKIIQQTALTQNDFLSNNEDLRAIAQAADIMGYQLIKYRDGLTQRDYLILTEQDDKPMRYWGMYVFRLGASNKYVVQIPRPLFEINSFEYGVDLFERLHAQALMIGTTHPYANFDGSSDLINPDNKPSVYNLVNQALLREAHDEELMMVNTRAFSYRTDRPYPNADVVYSLAEGTLTREQLTGLQLNLLGSLENDGLKVQLIDGSEQTSGYEVGSTAQAFYLEATTNKNFAVLWLSPTVRAGYRQQNENQLQAAQFNSLNISSLEENLGRYLQDQHGFSSTISLDEGFRNLVNQYMAEQDVKRLQQVVGNAKNNGYHLTRVLDRDSKQAFLQVKNSAGVTVALANLAGRTQEASYVDVNLPISGQVIEFVNQRKTWLLRHPG
jgi:gamma-polyglutamate biosynthesis protein CapC